MYFNPLVTPEPLSKCSWGGAVRSSAVSLGSEYKAVCCEGSFQVLLFLRIVFNLLFFVCYSNLLLSVSIFLFQDPSKDPWAEAQNWIKEAWSNLSIGSSSFKGEKYSLDLHGEGQGIANPLTLQCNFTDLYFLATQCLRKNNCFDCHVFHHLKYCKLLCMDLKLIIFPYPVCSTG